MNEQIRKLAEQAESYANSKIHMTGWNYAQEYNKKFAELIVRECMDVVDGYTKQRAFDTYYNAVEQIEALFGIKHFGVEE
jgi:hypothetical protein